MGEEFASADHVARELPLVDHHCHGVMREPVTRELFESLATESDWPDPDHSVLDTQIGLVFRHLCGPVLGLEPNCPGEDYWSRRQELGDEEVTRRLLTDTGISTYIVDTGFQPERVLDPAALAAVTGARSAEIVRLESLLEQAAANGTTAAGLVDAFDDALAAHDPTAVGYKSVIAYRYGLDFDPDAPTRAEVDEAAGRWLQSIESGAAIRVSDPVLMRFALHRAVELRKPIQFHVGFGDSDINLHRCDPSHMTEFIRRTRTSGAKIMLLHNYPFIREAGFLAHVFPHVYMDTGVILNYTGWRAKTAVRESLELSPFHKTLFSSDAFGLPELYHAGAALWRREVGRLFDEWLAEDLISTADAERYVRWMGAENAQRVYGADVA